jgi:hypothetical protein
MKFCFPILAILLLINPASAACKYCKPPKKQVAPPREMVYQPKGWSLDVGGAYTWISFSTPPTYTGNTGGVLGKLTYQTPDAFFGSLRSFYNIGPLSSSLDNTSFSEWYSEFVGGYCFALPKNLTFTLYAGIGLDFLHDNHSATSLILPIELRYELYYAILGFEIHRTWKNLMVGFQADCLPTFDPFLKIVTLPGAAWTLDNRVGASLRLPIAFRYWHNCWLEFAPYYRFFPIGDSDLLGFPERNLNEAGAQLTFRFFL